MLLCYFPVLFCLLFSLRLSSLFVLRVDDGKLTNMCFLAGNNYAIMNESSTHPAKIFFAQGCEISSQFEDLGRDSQS